MQNGMYRKACTCMQKWRCRLILMRTPTDQIHVQLVYIYTKKEVLFRLYKQKCLL